MKRVVVCCLVLSMLQGCSLAFVSGPPRGHEAMREFTCTEDGAGPAADTTFAVSGAASAVLSAQSDEEGSRTATIVNVAMTLVHAASAAYGVVMTYDCRAAQRAARTRRNAEHDAQVARITELETAHEGARCETSADYRHDRVCNEHRCAAVPPPPSVTTNPDNLQVIETPATTTDVPPPPPASPDPAPAVPPPPPPSAAPSSAPSVPPAPAP